MMIDKDGIGLEPRNRPRSATAMLRLFGHCRSRRMAPVRFLGHKEYETICRARGGDRVT